MFARCKRKGDYYHLRELEISDAEYVGRYARFSPVALRAFSFPPGPCNRDVNVRGCVHFINQFEC